jgi:hypothetical protein
LGGVEKGLAKHMLAATVTAKRNALGLTPISNAACKAIGAKSTAVAVLLKNSVRNEVVRYIPASTAIGPYGPSPDTIPPDMAAEVPVFSMAVANGIIAAKSTILSQLIVL